MSEGLVDEIRRFPVAFAYRGTPRVGQYSVAGDGTQAVVTVTYRLREKSQARGELSIERVARNLLAHLVKAGHF